LYKKRRKGKGGGQEEISWLIFTYLQKKKSNMLPTDAGGKVP